MEMKGVFRLLGLLLCVTVISLFTLTGLSYAVDKEEFNKEYKEAYQELLKENPELAETFRKEVGDAVRSGEVVLDKADKEVAKEKGEKGPDERDRYSPEFDPRKMEAEANALIKEGKTPQEVEKIMREKYGEPEGRPDFDLAKPEERAKALERLDKETEFLKAGGLSDDDLKTLKDAIARGDGDAADRIFEKMGPPEFEGRGPGDRGPGDFERYGPEGGREFTKEDMLEHFKEEMGREPTAQEREMMEREFERHGPEFDRPEFDRPEFDRPEFDRMGREPTEQEREMMEREYERFNEREFEKPPMDERYDYPPPPPPSDGENPPPPPPPPPEPPPQP